MDPDSQQLPATAAAAAAMDAPEAAIGRTRTFFIFITGAEAGDHEESAGYSVRICPEEPDWQNLLPDIVSKVAEFLLGSDVTDYIRLRAVCNPWRSATKADPMAMGMVPRYFPRNWDIMKTDKRGDKTRFVNSLTGASIWLQIPSEYGKVIASAEGCLILASDECRCDEALRLFNPVTRAVAYLPAVPCDSVVHAAGFVYNGDGEDDDADPTVVLCVAEADDMKRIVYAKPGDTAAWLIVNDEENGELLPFSMNALSVGGRFYVPTPTGNVRELKLRPRPHLVYVARQEARHRCDSFDVTSSLENHLDGMVLLRFDDHVEVFTVKFTHGNGSLTLVEDQEELDNIFFPWFTLGKSSSD